MTFKVQSRTILEAIDYWGLKFLLKGVVSLVWIYLKITFGFAESSTEHEKMSRHLSDREKELKLQKKMSLEINKLTDI